MEDIIPSRGIKLGHYIQCENCGITVYKTNSQFEKHDHHFCSVKCQKEWLHNETYENRACEICGSLFHVAKKSKQRFCCVECQNKWQKTNTGHKNPKFEGATVKCEWCNADVVVGKYNLTHSKHHFCCKDCLRSWYSAVFSQSDEWKEESKRRAVRILESGVFSRQTIPQKYVNDMLDENGIEYVNEYSITYYAIDNYLPKQGLFIEVMGDYWHCSPLLKGNGPSLDARKHRVSRDKAKHTYIKNKYNVDVLYLWESDIIAHRDLCVSLIKLYIDTPNCLPNYHSFNYHLNTGEIELNQNIIYMPY